MSDIQTAVAEKYNFDLFDGAAARNNRPERKTTLRVVKGNKYKIVHARIVAARMVAIAMLILCSVMFLTQEANITRATGEATRYKKELVQLQSEYNYLQTKYYEKTITNVQEKAAKLGMLPAIKDQITYIKMTEPQVKVYRTKTEEKIINLWKTITTWFVAAAEEQRGG